MAIPIKAPLEVESMARAGVTLDRVLGAVQALVTPGVTTGQIADAVEDALSQVRATSLLKGFSQRPNGAVFPASACVSVNEEVTHGLPGKRLLHAGDCVKLDIALRFEGWCVDAARTIVLPGGDMRGLRLVSAAREAMQAALSAVRPGVRWSTIAQDVEKIVAQRECHLVAGYVGHGVGKELHEAPRVCFARGDFTKITDDFTLFPGMTLCIEPVVGEGSSPFMTNLMPDGWTVVSNDRRWSAHEEATIAVTRTGCRILAGRPGA